MNASLNPCGSCASEEMVTLAMILYIADLLPTVGTLSVVQDLWGLWYMMCVYSAVQELWGISQWYTFWACLDCMCLVCNEYTSTFGVYGSVDMCGVCVPSMCDTSLCSKYVWDL